MKRNPKPQPHARKDAAPSPAPAAATPPQAPPPPPPPPPQSATGCLIRMYWAMCGPILLVATAQAIASRKLPLGSALDFVYAALLLSLVVVRRFDRGAPSAAEDAGISVDIGRTGAGAYTAVAVAGGGALFLIAHFVAPALFG